jgi:hypothetical protein
MQLGSVLGRDSSRVCFLSSVSTSGTSQPPHYTSVNSPGSRQRLKIGPLWLEQHSQAGSEKGVNLQERRSTAGCSPILGFPSFALTPTGYKSTTSTPQTTPHFAR